MAVASVRHRADHRASVREFIERARAITPHFFRLHPI
jgi:hypothetical protein